MTNSNRPKPGKKKSSKSKKPSNLRPYFTSKSGRVIWARDYGYVGWPIGGRK